MARVLIIDDDDPTRLAIRTMLELDGHEVTEASDGEIGQTFFQQNPTDLVIMDLLMPNKNGL
ncbi:MAG: response regulator, partial [Candidatus Latescibacteria bacterium]|nr:response regulator [Candidatus Latescibacterota bacterium]